MKSVKVSNEQSLIFKIRGPPVKSYTQQSCVAELLKGDSKMNDVVCVTSDMKMLKSCTDRTFERSKQNGCK